MHTTPNMATNILIESLFLENEALYLNLTQRISYLFSLSYLGIEGAKMA